MKSSTLGALLSIVFATPAFAAFVGAADPGLWTTSNTGTLIGGSPTLGSASFSPTTLLLTGSNSSSPDPANFEPGCAGGIYGDLTSPCQTQTVLAGAGTYSFDWSYETFDNGGPGGDIFGVLIDGTRIAISDPGGPVAQPGGHLSFNASTSFGFFINCTDCIEGGAAASITNFESTNVAIPEPGSAGLALLAACSVVVVRRRTRTRQAD